MDLCWISWIEAHIRRGPHESGGVLRASLAGQASGALLVEVLIPLEQWAGKVQQHPEFWSRPEAR